MRYLVLTDIHANLEALDTCLADAERHGYDRTLVLGDLVGYGPDPNAVIERIVALDPLSIVRGNHDKVASGIEQADGFNSLAKQAVRWTFNVLTTEHRAWLAALPTGPLEVTDLVEICHGSPLDEDAYVFDELDAARALKFSTRPLCLFGHTHWAVAYQLTTDGVETIGPTALAQSQVVVEPNSKHLINPGAVGQPRDGDPRAGYAIVDERERRMELYRVAYAIADVQAKMAEAGLPDVLAQRLAMGR